MEISNVYVSKNTLQVTLQATIRVGLRNHEAYIRYPVEYAPYILTDAVPFVAAMLFPAMRMKRTVTVKGPLDNTFADNISQIGPIVEKWNINLKSQQVKTEKKVNDTYLKPGTGLVFFSGGVDSMATFYRHKDKISYLAIVKGFDIGIENEELWNKTISNIKEFAKKENKKVIEIETNIKDIMEEYIDWDSSHGGALAAVALAIRPLVSDVYIGSTYSLDQLAPWGSHPDIDKYWSSALCTFHHDAAECSRIQKVAYIADHPSALEHLRVCWFNKDNSYNCGRCEKCIRTMVNLLLADSLDKASTFPHTIQLADIRNINFHETHDSLFFQENLLALEKRGLHQDLAREMRLLLQKRLGKKSAIQRMSDTVLRYDKLYNQRKLAKFVLQLKKGNYGGVVNWILRR
jgi:hypothetical protein